MGRCGAGWATAMSIWVKAIVYLLLPMQRAHREKFGNCAECESMAELMRRILYLRLSERFADAARRGRLYAIHRVYRPLGDVPAEATSMAFSVSTLAFMPIYGLHLGVSVLVGEHLGENREQPGRSRDIHDIANCVDLHGGDLAAIRVCAGNISAEDSFAREDAHRRIACASVARRLRFCCNSWPAYNLLDATQMVFVGALKGAGDTRFLLRVSVCSPRY